MTKRMLAIFLVLMMALAFVGCKTATPEPPAADDPAVDVPEPQVEEPTVEPAVELAWPEKTIEIIIPYSPGGDTDTYAREIAAQLEKTLGVSVMCTNVVGSSGSIAADQVRNAKPDGYTVLWTHNTLLCGFAFQQTDYAHEVFEVANIMAYNGSYYFFSNSEEFTTWEEFVAYCEANPGKANIVVPVGGFAHLVAMCTIAETGIDVNIVDADSAASCCVEVFSKRAQGVPGTLQSMGDYFTNGSFSALAGYANERLACSEDTPTFKELGYDGLTAYMNFGFFFPKGTDEAIIDAWNAACEQIVASDSYKTLLATYNAEPVFYAKDAAVAEWDTMLASFLAVQEFLLN